VVQPDFKVRRSIAKNGQTRPAADLTHTLATVSAIVADDGVIYTMYRSKEKDKGVRKESWSPMKRRRRGALEQKYDARWQGQRPCSDRAKVRRW